MFTFFGLFARRELVSYQAKYQNNVVKGCAIVYWRNQRECIEQIKQCERKISGKVPEQVILTARSSY